MIKTRFKTPNFHRGGAEKNMYFCVPFLTCLNFDSLPRPFGCGPEGLCGKKGFEMISKALRRALALGLAFSLILTPGLVQLALAQDESNQASDEETAALQQLAKAGYLGDKKDFYLNAKSLTEDDVTDGLLKINDQLSPVDPKSLHPGSTAYSLEDLNALLKLVEEKAEDIRDRKVSAWKFETHLKKMIAALSPAPVETPAAATPIPATATPTPIPGPSAADWEEMKKTQKDLAKKVDEMQDSFDKKIEALQKTGDANKDSNANLQDELKLVKNLLDRVQGDLKKTDDRLEEVAQKASSKSITDTQLQQELTVMHKDLRDNTLDVGILKEEMAKLSKSDTQAGQSPFDEFLSSKWLAGGALVVGLTALVISLTRK